MTSSHKKPPRLAEILLKILANHNTNSAIIGDLEEEYSILAENRGETYALFWYWKLILISLPSFLKNHFYWNMTLLKNYTKIAFRNVWRSKLHTSINLAGLAVGMACFILISLWVNDELRFDKFQKNRDRLFLLTIEHPSGVVDRNAPYALASILGSKYPEIEEYTRIYELGQTSCSFKYQPENAPQIKFYEGSFNLVDPGFFSMFSFPFIYGRPENALKNSNSLVIREEIAKKYFGDKNPVGEKITYNNQQDFIISGVIHIPIHSHLQLDFIAPLENELSNDWNWRDPSYLLLDKQVSLLDFKEKIAHVFNEQAPYNLPGKFKVGIMSIEDVHLSFGRRTYVYIFSAIAFFILFIACVNYMNLATASSIRRFREVGLRKVVGAKKNQLVYQFLGESLLMSALAFVISIILVKLFLPLLNELTTKSITLSLAETPAFFGYLIVLIFVVGILAGIYPAFHLTSCSPIDTLRSSLRFSSNRSVFRVISVVGQFTLSVLLIVCTVVVYKQLNYIQTRPLGLSTDHVLKIQNNPILHRRFQSFKTELLRNPNISRVTRSQAIPYDDDFKTNGLKWRGMDPNLSPNIRYSITDIDFFKTFNMKITQGRSFSNENPRDRFNYIINQTAVKYMGLKNPIGKRLQFWGHEGQIIGVVKDFHHVSFHREIMPHLFTINPRLYNNWMKFIFVKVSSENIPSTLGFIEETAQKFGPDYPFEISFLDQGLAELYLSEQTLGKIFTYFAFLAVFISCLGILGLSSFNAEKRTKEIGIRRILGSSTSGIVVLLSKQFTRWVLLANIIAWPIAYYAMHKWLQNFAYRTGLSFYLFVFAGITALAAAAIPILYQAWKAAGVQPVTTLRHE